MSDDAKALIERLRDAADRKWPDPNVARYSLFAEAADTIARLEAERDAARVSIPTETMEREFSAHHRRGYEKGRREAMEECARIADEHARRNYPWGSENTDRYHAQADWAERIAAAIRAAMKGER